MLYRFAAWLLPLSEKRNPSRDPFAKGLPPGKGARPPDGAGGSQGPASGAVGGLSKRFQRAALTLQLAVRAAGPSRVLLALCALAVLNLPLFLIADEPSRPLFTPGGCTCPSTPAARATLLDFTKTALVVRVSRTGALHPLSSLLGPPGLVRRPLAVSPSDVAGCGGLRAGSLALLLLADVVRAGEKNATAPAASLLGCAKGVLLPWSDWRAAAVAPRRTAAGNSPWWRAPVHRPLWLDAKTTAARATAGKGPLPRAEWWVRPGVSIVAACMDRAGTLAKASASWFSAHGVDEIVLVDWGSAAHAVDALPASARGDPRLVLARVEGERLWALSRAYNLALALSSRQTVLKVDCDTRIGPDFVERHSLQGGDFFAGDWRAVNLTSKKKSEENKLHVNGLLMVQRDHILGVGGYDERIATYGWDDTDLVERLSATREYRRFDYSDVEHIPHPAALRVVHQGGSALVPRGHRLAANVEIQRNRILLTKFGLRKWRATSRRGVWDVELRSSASARGGQGIFGRAGRIAPSDPDGPVVFVASAAMKVPALSELVTKEQEEIASDAALRSVLVHMGNGKYSFKTLKNATLAELQTLFRGLPN